MDYTQFSTPNLTRGCFETFFKFLLLNAFNNSESEEFHTF